MHVGFPHAAPRTTRNATPTLPKDQQRPQAQPPTQRHTHSSHGRRLARAFTDVELLPALSEARERVLAITAGPSVATGELIAAVESDAALTLAVMRTANDDLPTAARLDTVLGAIEQIGTRGVRSLASRPSLSTSSSGGRLDLAPQTFRLHGLATQRAADRIAAEIFHPHRDRLALSSLLHDIGKLVLIRAYPGYPEQVHRTAQLPEERIHSERRELGVDHALVGGVLLRRWGLPTSIAGAVERHHDPAADGEAAVVRVADMLAHYQHGDSISPAEMLAGARTIGLDPKQVRRLISDLSSEPGQLRQVSIPAPSPLASYGSCSAWPTAASIRRSRSI